VWAAVDQLRADGTSVLLVTHELDEAERLCDRVVAMRSGRVLESGSPAELVDRHARAATITFTQPAGSETAPARLAELPGVVEVQRRAGQVRITGDRTAIAHVGAALVRAGRVPPDLSVQIPTLEDALLGLLDRAESAESAHSDLPLLTGAPR
jgi:ABC-2 type transport system ATP-binding protein